MGVIRSPLELAITGLLWRQHRSGYDLLKIFSETAMGSFGSSPGAVYPALKRLETNGIISGGIENRDTLRPKRIYSLTTDGLEMFKQHLRGPVTRDDLIRNEEGIMLRFVFCGEVLGRDEAIRVLEQLAAETDAYIPDLERQLIAMPGITDEYGRCALRHGIDQYLAGALWARNTIKELKQTG